VQARSAVEKLLWRLAATGPGLVLAFVLALALSAGGHAKEPAKESAKGSARSPAAAHPMTVLLVADPWCPYNCDPANGPEGFMVDLVRAILEPAGYTVVYRIESWAVAVRMAEEGAATGILGAGYGDSEKLIYPDRAFGSSPNGYAVRADDPFQYAGIRSLEKRRLAVIRGYSYGDELDAYLAPRLTDQARVEVVSGFGPSQLGIILRRLVAGDFDTIPDDINVLRWMVASLNMSQTVRLIELSNPEGVYVALSPHYPQAKKLAMLLSEGIDRLRAEGALAGILARYGLSDWEPATSAAAPPPMR
jgi:polar amino acid transport system substrate-binding protein